jgi:putative hydrolase of the HAD superfamily
MPDQVLYVGNDMRNDICPAAATGFHTALFAGDKRSLRLREDDRKCARTRPDIIITDLMQLLENIRA